MPDLGPNCVVRLTADTVIRAKQAVNHSRVNYWDGEPVLFNLCD